MKELAKLAFLIALLAAGWFTYQRLWRVPSPEELEALRREHERLRVQIHERLAADAEPPDTASASVVVGVPLPFAERFGRQVSKHLLKEMTLTLRNIAIEKSDDLHARLLVGRSLLGHFTANVDVDEVSARLRAGKPQLRMDGQRLAVTLPVDVSRGAGQGRVRFRWDGRGVAGSVCGDFEMSGEIAGTVVPAAYTLRAQLTLTTEGSALVAIPELDDVVLPLRLEPSPESWKLLDLAVEQRSPLCRSALGTAGVPEKVRELVARGFQVKLPRRLLPAVRFPVEMEKEVPTEGGPLHVQVKPVGLSLVRNTIWYRMDVALLGKEPAAPAPALESETDAEAQGLEALPVVEKDLEVGPETEGD